MRLMYEHEPNTQGKTTSVITNFRYINLVLSECGPVGRVGTKGCKGVSEHVAKIVLCAIARHAQYEELESFPGVETIAKDTGVNVNTVTLAVRELQRQEWLTIQKGKHSARKHHYRPPHRYQLRLPAVLKGDPKKLFAGYLGHYADSGQAPATRPFKRRIGGISDLSLAESDNPF